MRGWSVIAIGTIVSGAIAEGGPTMTYAQGFGKFAAILGIAPRSACPLASLR